MSAEPSNSSIHRRNFLRSGAIAAAGALVIGSAAKSPAASAEPISTAAATTPEEKTALNFVRQYSSRIVTSGSSQTTTRLVSEMRDVTLLGEAFRDAGDHGIARLHVAGTVATFAIGGRTFEVETLCPQDFAVRTAGRAG